MITALLNMLGLSYAKALAILAVVGVVVAGYFWINNFVDEKAELAADLADQKRIVLELQASVEAEREASRIERERVKDAQRDISKLQIEMAESRVRNKEMVRVFDRHDLSRLILAKPTLVTTRMRRATADVWLQFESAARTAEDSTN